MKKFILFLLCFEITAFCFAKENYTHNQKIEFTNSGYGICVYSKIYELNEKKSADFELKKGDIVHITEATFDSEEGSSYGNLWLEISISSANGNNEDNKKHGYLCIWTTNPFKNWKQIDTIDGKAVMSWKDSCEISYGYDLKEKPDHNSKTVKEIQKRIDDTKMYEVLALSEDKYPDEEGKSPDYWVLIDFNGNKCWLHGSHCSKDIGGPTFKTPENVIYYELIYANEI